MIKNIYLLSILLLVVIFTSCSRKTILSDPNKDVEIYNKALRASINYLSANNILVGESDSMFLNPFIRIDTMSLNTYGAANWQLYMSTIDTFYNFKQEVTPNAYKYYKSIQELRNFQSQHDINNVKFDIPVELITFKKAHERGIKQFYVNTVSPLIAAGADNKFALWISKWHGIFLDNFGLSIGLQWNGDDFVVTRHTYRREGDNPAVFIKPDYIKYFE